jgi:peptidoglycan/LPS O-acetylase OafA/YrhL
MVDLTTRYTMQKLLGRLRVSARPSEILEMRHPAPTQTLSAGHPAPGNASSHPIEKTRYHVLDLLRIAAASAAMIYHYAFRGYAADGLSIVRFDDLSPVVRYGHTGSFFFLISSFVISLSAERRSATAFLSARLRRLVPAFWICCLLTALASWLFAQPQFPVTLPQLLGHLTMLRVLVGPVDHGLIDGAYWTLQIELRFYLLVALLLWWRPGQLGRTLPRVMAVGMVLSAVNFFLVASGRDGIYVLNFVPLFASGVAYGSLARRRASMLDWTLLVTAVPLSLAYAAHDASVLTAHYRVHFSPMILAATLGVFQAVLFMLTVVRIDIPSTPIIRTFGMLTYPLFLLHQNVGYMILNATAGRVPPMMVLGALCVGMPLVAFTIGRWIEPRARSAIDLALASLQSHWRWRRRPAAAAASSSAITSGAAA